MIRPQFFLHYLLTKGLSTPAKKYLESDNSKWSKMALKVGGFSQQHSPLQHGEIRKFWKVSHGNTVQPTRCTRERRPEVFPHQSSIYYKPELVLTFKLAQEPKNVSRLREVRLQKGPDGWGLPLIRVTLEENLQLLFKMIVHHDALILILTAVFWPPIRPKGPFWRI